MSEEMKQAESRFERGYIDGLRGGYTIGLASDWYEAGFAIGLRAQKWHEGVSPEEAHKLAHDAMLRFTHEPY